MFEILIKYYKLLQALIFLFLFSCENDAVRYEPFISWVECKLFDRNLLFEDGAIAGKITGWSISDSIVIRYSIDSKKEEENNYAIEEIYFILSDDLSGLDNYNGEGNKNRIIYHKSGVNDKTLVFAVKPYQYGIFSKLIYVSTNVVLHSNGSSKDEKYIVEPEMDFAFSCNRGYFTFEYTCQRK
jgi:hypothetical protein